MAQPAFHATEFYADRVTTLLIAEDDPGISEPLSRALKSEGYDVILATDGGSALSAVGEFSPALVVLDLGLPGIDGLEVCRRIRAAGNTVPVLMLTARSDEVDFVVGLDAGADDYVTKPFRMSELQARVRAMLRRRVGDVITGHGIRVDVASRRVTVEGKDVALTPKEFDLLRLLMTNIDRVVSREEIVDVVWGDRDILVSKTLDMHVHSLRHKLADGRDEPIDRFITTLRGTGIRFNP